MTTQSTETLHQQVMELVGKQVDIPVERISRDSEFEADLGFDSLAKVQFIMDVEERFDINVPDDVAERIKTVRQTIDQIERALAKKG